MKRLLRRPGTSAFLTSLAVLAVYLFTAAPGVGFIDSGELSAVACTMGVAHPTGYPFFTLLGRLFSRFPVAPAEITRLNIMAALLCAAAAGILVLVFRRVTLLSDRRSSAGAFATVSASGGALILAFSSTYWSQALEVEVYPFECFDHGREGAQGFITITGGKTVTARAMAEKVVDIVCSKVGVRAECRTRATLLHSYREFYR